MNKEEQIYLEAIKNILENGYESEDRTGVGTKFLVSQKFDFDISNGKIPLWTTRKINYKNQWVELLWMLRGDTNIEYLKNRGVNIWDSWADENGSIGNTYGKQMRNWAHPKSDEQINHEYEQEHKKYSDYWDNKKFCTKEVRKKDFFDFSWEGAGFEFKFLNRNERIDQFKNLIEGIKNNVDSRRHILTLWNSGEYTNLPKPYLPSCHSNHIQITIINKKYLHYQMLARSLDAIPGYCPWQHALFANIIGRLTGYEPKSMSIMISNFHCYKNQFEVAQKLLQRTPEADFPTLNIKKELKTIEDVENSEWTDYELLNYAPQSFLKIPISI